MDSPELESEEESVEHAVELLDRLLALRMEGRSVLMGQYEASTVLALLMDAKYRAEVMSRLDDFADVESGD